MRISLIIILFSTTLLGQNLKEKLIIDGLSITHSIVRAYDMHYQMKDRHFYKTGNEELKKYYNKLWHHSGGVELALTFAIGGYAYYKNKDDLIGYGQDALMFASLRWIGEGIYNELNYDDFFHRSKGSTAMLEPHGYWWLKLTLLTGAILWKYWDDIF